MSDVFLCFKVMRRSVRLFKLPICIPTLGYCVIMVCVHSVTLYVTFMQSKFAPFS